MSRAADLATDVTVAEDRQTPLRTWAICGLMLLATMLNYMDRQTLAQQAKRHPRGASAQ